MPRDHQKISSARKRADAFALRRAPSTLYRMRIWRVLLGLGLTCACGGNAAIESQQSSSGNAQKISSAGAASVAECNYPMSSADAGPGACTVARALVECTSDEPNAATCECLSEDPTTCAFCEQQLKGNVTCVSKCAGNEYAMGCGGPPIPDGDVHYQDAPSGCAGLGYSPAGSEFVCCPCL